jgi:two-component system, cell cycle sensor histidine kinase and response regulator CckA
VAVLGLVVWRQWYAHRAHAAALASQAQLDARYTALVKEASDVVAIADADGTLQFISPSAERVLGYAPGQVIGSTIRSFLHPDEQDSWSAILADLIARGELEATPPSTWRIRAADGRWIHLQATAVNRMSDPAVRGVILNGRDVTALTDLEERLRQAKQMEAIGRFASVIAHDFNHVLSAIKLNVQLQRDVPTDRASADEILSAVELGAALTRQLMAVSRHRSVAPVVLDVVEVLRETERAVQTLVGAEATLHCETVPGPVLVRADAAQLRQVLMNLIINARDAAPQGHIRVALRTRQLGIEDTRALIGLKPGPHAVLTVEDDGVGMSLAVLQRLFEPFFTTKSGGRGTGLGLTIVYGIVTAFGGVIDASSAEGTGSRFEILLPIADPQRPTAVVDARTPTTGRTCVLIVDDDAAIRSALQRAFTIRGCVALVAEDGVDALARLREHGTAIHVVLTDMRMPRLDGPGLIEAMGREWPTLPVIGMSGFLHADDHARLSPRVRRIIEKPFTLDEVVRAVDDALA